MTGTTTTPTAGVPAPQTSQFVNRQDTAQRPSVQTSLFANNPQKIESFPRGYPSLSAFMSTDSDFTMFRCFARLHTRVLLNKQDELAQLEERIDQLDQADRKVENYYLMTNRRRGGDEERRALLSQIEGKLNEYKRPEPEATQIASLRTYMKTRKPIAYSEATFLNDWSDLRRARHPVEKGGLEDIMERFSGSPGLRGVYKFLSLFDPSPKSDDPQLIVLKPSRLLAVSRAVTSILAVATLVVPIGVLYCVQPVPTRLCIITAFTVIFSSALCWLTSSRNYEIFSATAAYCAVLVVFVGSLPDS